MILWLLLIIGLIGRAVTVWLTTRRTMHVHAQLETRTYYTYLTLATNKLLLVRMIVNFNRILTCDMNS